MTNLLNDRSAMQVHLSLHGWFAMVDKASFDEVRIYRLINLAMGARGEAFSTRENEREVFRMRAALLLHGNRIPFDEIPDNEWRRLVRRAIDHNLIEGFSKGDLLS